MIRAPHARRPVRVLLGAIVALTIAASPAAATNYRLYGPGPRYAAMAGAFTAVGDDFSGGYANPAAIIQTNTTRIGLGYQWTYEATEAQGESRFPGDRSTDSLYLGFALTLPFADWLKDRIAFGYNFFQPVDFVTSLEVPPASEPQFVLLEQAPRANVMHAALATDPLPWLLIGAGATFATDLGGSLDLKPGIRRLGGTESILTTVDQEVQPLISPDVGVYVKGGELTPSLEGWSFGFTWRYEFFLDLQIPLTILLSGIPLQLDFTSKLLYTPETYTLGAAYRFGDDGVVALDLSYNVWSNYEAPSLVIDTEIDIPVLPVELKDGPKIDANFSDTITARIGADYRAVAAESFELWLRGGYAYDPTPVPKQTGTSNFLDGDKHIFGVGLGFRMLEIFGERLDDKLPTLNLSFQTQYLSETRARKDPEVVDPSNPGYPEVTGKGLAYYLGLSLSLAVSP